MTFAGIASVSTTKVDLFVNFADTGNYEVLLLDVDDVSNVYMSTDSGATTSNSIILSNVALDFTSSTPGKFLRFNWNSEVPLYVFTSSGTGNLKYLLTPVGATNVNLSVGPC